MCKKSGDGTCFAMKEILLTNPNLGKTSSERNKSTGNIIQETKFLKEQVQSRTQSIFLIFSKLILPKSSLNDRSAKNMGFTNLIKIIKQIMKRL